MYTSVSTDERLLISNIMVARQGGSVIDKLLDWSRPEWEEYASMQRKQEGAHMTESKHAA